ncbi:ABC transporter ATP-binding protein [Marinobacter salarius]|jgi:HlyD family secretion protein|uniref:ABC transporter ATP-binding protein n=1 Tax=Marinobacter TaxID=2742 RepID=UPI00241CAE29|nr:ABC transporter ATP-binding protein [Marinobacter salarius]|tara:strand:+ start:7403 stop:9199 length:1797 start_codon:yes stop_codon:yes gene_type:complete
MFSQLKELYSLLTIDQRKKLIRLQILVVLMSFAEIAGVVSIGPFMALVGEISQLEGEGFLAEIYRGTGLESPRDFLFWLGIFIVLFLALATCISMFTIWRLSMYGAQVGAELANRLFRHYVQQPWLFHATGSSSQLTNRIAQEVQRITNQIINPLMQMNAKLVMALFMAVAVFLYNPAVAVSGLVIFSSAYWLLYKVVRRRLIWNGRSISEAQQMRFKLMGEGFGGIKDVLLLGRQDGFTNRFKTACDKYAAAQGANMALAQAPRYAMELVAFGSVIFLVLYLLGTHEGNLGAILPVLSVYALAGMKMLPAFQQAYAGLSQIRGNLAAFDTVRDDLRASSLESARAVAQSNERLVPQQEVRLSNVLFRYPGKEEPALNNIDMRIPANGVIGLVGASGSGKSTAIDLLLGLIEPQEGSLFIDGEPLTNEKRRAWQNTVGFVPQSIFLADSSIRENIAFGLPFDAIDEESVRRAAKMAHLDELLAELPRGLDTEVGERGVQLSGGQKQRIGIARALYNDADVLVLDEATSALDGITEKLIMDAIHDFSGKKTIIMIAHRLATVRQCETIYLLEKGELTDHGSYNDLALRSPIFRRMADNA